MTPRPARERRPLASSPFRNEPELPIEEFAVDDQVSHDTYGLGRVTGLETSAVTVAFGTQQVRVTSPFRKMQKL